VFVITDHFTKYSEAFATPNQTAETAAKIIVEEIVIKYGSPSEILSDQGSQFSAEIANLHPQSNGQTERFNRTLSSMLRPYINKQQTDWDEYIRYVLYAILSYVWP
jgi:transposase InsO family protein